MLIRHLSYRVIGYPRLHLPRYKLLDYKAICLIYCIASPSAVLGHFWPCAEPAGRADDFAFYQKSTRHCFYLSLQPSTRFGGTESPLQFMT